MATIGTFTSTGNGFTGTVRTLALNAKAKLVRVENPSDKGPHFRIFAGNVELEQFPTGMNRVGIPKTARVRFKLHAGEGGQHVWPGRFRLIFVKG
ncbi:DUF736 family protein [Bradyrhizobium sp. 2S1]|uniref:DUF736 family protein n=1 Tax=Bradyrhizobium sp. 2S1 TaxID=1404429 RepID=UPI001CD0BFCB|nr:DUF736 family protein [Bradyrhizobium sp. 2S1]MCK7664679.1 DUF736 family protein [Bradyrhizobium sp. 2S1]